MFYKIIIIVSLFCVTVIAKTFSQADTLQSTDLQHDSTQLDDNDSNDKEHSPRKATIYSAILPGLGQAYNKSYWKIPVIYAGFGITAYFVYTNKKEYKLFKDAYIYVASGSVGDPPNIYAESYNVQTLKRAKDEYRYSLELSYIIGGFIYILNIIEATVDAHFFNFDVSDDLSLRIEPQIRKYLHINQPSPCLSLILIF